MSAYRRAGVFVVSLAVLLALVAGQGPQTATGATKGTYSGSWSGSQTTEGMNGTGSGSISFNVNAETGAFTCSFSGSGSFAGTSDGARVKGTVSMRGSGCSGSYDPKTGAVDGAMTLGESLNWNWSATHSGQTYTGSDSKTISLGAGVSGNVKRGSGSVSYSGGNLSWRVSGSGGDPEKAVEFKDLTPGEKDAALEMMIGDIPPEKLLKMTDQDLQKYIDKKFGALDSGQIEGAKGGGIADPKAAERVERAAQAADAKAGVNAAFESSPADIARETLAREIREMNDPYVRGQAAQQFVDNADKEINRVSDSIKQKKEPLKKETGFVDGLKDYVSGKLGNTEAGGAAVDGAGALAGDYATKKFESAIEDFDTAKSIYETGKSALEIKENIDKARESFEDLQKKSLELKKQREQGHITGQQADQIKALHILGRFAGKVGDALPIKGAGEMIQSTFEAFTQPALVIATLGKTRDDLVNDPNMNLEGRRMHVSEMSEKPDIIERDDPTRPGQKIKYMFNQKSGEYHQLKEKKKEPDLYEWAKGLFKKKETPAHLKKYH